MRVNYEVWEKVIDKIFIRWFQNMVVYSKPTSMYTKINFKLI